MANEIIFTNNLREVLTGFENAKENMLIDIGSTCQDYAKKNTPVRRGILRDSIGVVVVADDEEVYVGTMVDKFPKDEEPYGKYIELGARGVGGRHMLQRAVTEHKEEYKQIAENRMKNA